MDAAGNKPPKDGLANVKRPKIGKGKNDSPEAVLYGDKAGVTTCSTRVDPRGAID